MGGGKPAASTRLSPFKVWLLAARLPTLPAAVVPVLVGSAAAAAAGTFRPWVMAAALVASLLIQVGTNLANDYFDFKKGADTEARLGPTRVTQSGLLTPAQVVRGMIVTFSFAVLVGLYLIFVGGWPILLIGVLSILAGIAYTGGPYPLAYHGLGDLFVFLFFGVVAVTGTYYVHTLTVDWVAAAASVPVGLLANAILVVNNLRDVETDAAAGKRTLAVRLGVPATRAHYTICLVGAYLVPLLLRLGDGMGAGFWLPWLTLPLGYSLLRTVLGGAAGKRLNPVLKRTGQLHLFNGVLLAVGFLWQ